MFARRCCRGITDVFRSNQTVGIFVILYLIDNDKKPQLSMVSRIGLHIDLLLCEVEVVACSALALSAAIGPRTWKLKDLNANHKDVKFKAKDLSIKALA